MDACISQIVWFEDLRRTDIARVGGKNASLGEMVAMLQGAAVKVPPGFALTSEAYWEFIDANGLREPISSLLEQWAQGKRSLAETGDAIRQAIVQGDWPPATAQAVRSAYAALGSRSGQEQCDVAVRSSATAEDLPDASFAGQQETYLHIRGEKALLDACRRCYASLFTDRAIRYRQAKGYDHMKVALSVGVQRMVRSDRAGAGVMFSIDTETGFDRMVLITASWGLGENVVQGAVEPDEYEVFKPLLANEPLTPIVSKKRGAKRCKLVYATQGEHPTQNVPTSKHERESFVLDDAEILKLARSACAIEKHYGQPMDIEWAKDGDTGELFIVQARPETVQSQRAAGGVRSWRIKQAGARLATGISIGEAIASGRVCII